MSVPKRSVKKTIQKHFGCDREYNNYAKGCNVTIEEYDKFHEYEIQNAQKRIDELTAKIQKLNVVIAKLPSEVELHNIWFIATGVTINLSDAKGLKAIAKRLRSNGGE